MSEARLHDALAALDLGDQPGDVAVQLSRHATDVVGDDRAEQQAPEARGRVDGKHQVPERHTTRHRRC